MKSRGCQCDNSPMNLEKNVPLQPYNTFGIAAKAHMLLRVWGESDLRAVLADLQLATLPRQVLGAGAENRSGRHAPGL